MEIAAGKGKRRQKGMKIRKNVAKNVVLGLLEKDLSLTLTFSKMSKGSLVFQAMSA